MRFLTKYYNHLLEIHLHEKLHLYLPHHSYVSLMPKRLILKFQLKNNMSNKTLLLCNRILIERLTGQTMKYVKAKRHQHMFNVPKDTQFGCLLTLRDERLLLFSMYFIMYSLTNVNSFAVFTKKVNARKIVDKTKDRFRFGMTKLLFFVSLSISKDWDSFSYIYNHLFYGIDFSFEGPSQNVFINKVVMSHLGLMFH